jgi:hypothetical protein
MDCFASLAMTLKGQVFNSTIGAVSRAVPRD